MPNSFAAPINEPKSAQSESFFSAILGQYEQVVMETLFASFGLDALFCADHDGGEVDTIHNVRSGIDFKNTTYAESYKNREAYNEKSYHSHPVFTHAKREAKKSFNETGKSITDEYTGGRIGFHGKTKAIPPERKAELDHIVECKAIYEDKGRFISGLSGEDLANCPENFAFTNKSVNASMGAWAKGKETLDAAGMKAYLDAHPEIDATTRERMLGKYDEARKAYDSKVNKAYYTSKQFTRDTVIAAGKQSLKMGARALVAALFAEMWMSLREEVTNWKAEAKELLTQLGHSMKKFWQRACKKWAELIEKFLDGALAGLLSSLMTTLSNIFFSTARLLVKIVRQTWGSLVTAVKILLFNPDRLGTGELVRSVSKIVATSISVVAGILVTEGLNKLNVNAIPVIGEGITTFVGALVTGLLSCTVIYYLDTDPRINRLVAHFDAMRPRLTYADEYIAELDRQAELFDQYSALIMEMDLATLYSQMDACDKLLDDIETVSNSAIDLNDKLLEMSNALGLDFVHLSPDQTRNKLKTEVIKIS